MRPVQIVLDTNILVAAMRSRRGGSFRLLSLVGRSGAFEINLSVPLVFEYEDVLLRQLRDLEIDAEDVEAVLDYLCAVANRHEIFFLWRPVLRDPKDDFILELAVQAGCTYVVTFNTRDFAGAERFGIQALTPQEFLKEIGELP
jgi:putative PIN family toxin of toxin-antitoxin system